MIFLFIQFIYDIQPICTYVDLSVHSLITKKFILKNHSPRISNHILKTFMSLKTLKLHKFIRAFPDYCEYLYMFTLGFRLADIHKLHVSPMKCFHERLSYLHGKRNMFTSTIISKSFFLFLSLKKKDKMSTQIISVVN